MTVAMWIAVSAAMALTVRALSGRAYERDTPLADIAAVVARYGSGSATSTAVLVMLAPAVADILFFVPWGAVAFLSLDSQHHSQRMTYSAVFALGAAFALALLAWQVVLPMRITGGVDALWNVVGCASGAALGQARKRVRIRFE